MLDDLKREKAKTRAHLDWHKLEVLSKSPLEVTLNTGMFGKISHYKTLTATLKKTDIYYADLYIDLNHNLKIDPGEWMTANYVNGTSEDYKYGDGEIILNVDLSSNTNWRNFSGYLIIETNHNYSPNFNTSKTITRFEVITID